MRKAVTGTEPHTFGWLRRRDLEVVPTMHVWELPTGELVTNAPAQGPLHVMRSPMSGRVVCSGANGTFNSEGHLLAVRKAARSNG